MKPAGHVSVAGYCSVTPRSCAASTERPYDTVSDQQPTGDEHLSKRERQKARRAAKQEQQAQQAAAATRRRSGIIAVVVVLVLALGGFAGWQFYSGVQERSQAVAEAEELHGDYGCGDIEIVQNYGAAHFSMSEEELEANPPDVAYEDRPATSGIHLPMWSITGVFDKAIDERLLIHNMEHGYSVFWYDADAPSDQVDELKDWGEAQIDGSFPKIVVAEYPDPLPNGNFAAAGWDVRQECESFSDTIFLAFLDQHNGLESGAPEMTLQPHITDGVDPEETEGDLLYPPLAETEVEAEDTMDPGDLDDVEGEDDDGDADDDQADEDTDDSDD